MKTRIVTGLVILVSLIGMAFGHVIGRGVGKEVGSLLFPRTASTDKIVESTFAEGIEAFNKTLPRRLDAFTTVTNATFGNKKLTFTYVLDEQVYFSNSLVRELRSKITAPMCSNGETHQAWNELYGQGYRWEAVYFLSDALVKRIELGAC